MSKLDKMFTFAAPDDEMGNTELLFSKDTGEPFTREEMLGIINDPLCKSIMGEYGILSVIEGGPGELLLYTHDIGSYAIDQLDTIPAGYEMIFHSPRGGIETIDLQKAYYGCKLPHRTILGCKDCLYRDTKTSCRVKEIGLLSKETETRKSPVDIIEDKLLKSRKSKIGEFTYVSPRLTAMGDFAKTFRPVDEHDFTEVESRSEIVQQGLRERGRRRNFKKNVCPTCVVQQGCDRGYSESQAKHCEGPFDRTEQETIKHILETTNIPFNKYQLLYLALNSGELDNRYKRRKYWATFRMLGGMLTFGLCRVTTGDYEPFRDFNAAKALLCKYNNKVRIPGKGDKHLTPKMKALLIELAYRHYSPCRVSRWHTVQYDVLGIEYHPHAHHEPAWNLLFKFNSGSGGYYRPSGWVMPWSVTVKNFDNIFQEYTSLHTISQTRHPLSYYRFHREG